LRYCVYLVGIKENIKDAFTGRPGLLAVRQGEGMKHAETGQLYRRYRAEQPAFLSHTYVI
jgi:hypothetical protein